MLFYKYPFEMKLLGDEDDEEEEDDDEDNE